MTIGERIKTKRKEKNWSQRDLAAKMGYSHHSTLARIEAGKVDVSQTRIVQFAEVLGTTVAYLMGWEQMHEKNDILSDAIIRMRTDEDFMSVVESLMSLDSEGLAVIKQMASALKK